MPIELGIWRIDGEVVSVPTVSFENEARLEQILKQDISILGFDPLLVLGSQVITTFGKRVDLLAIDIQGTSMSSRSSETGHRATWSPRRSTTATGPASSRARKSPTSSRASDPIKASTRPSRSTSAQRRLSSLAAATG